MTTKNELEFVNKIISVAACLGASAADLFEDWHPAAPPATILFAVLGRAMRDNFDQVNRAARKLIFDVVEDMAINSDESVRSLALSGFVEAMISGEVFSREQYEKLTKDLGPVAREHADVWSSFHDKNTEGSINYNSLNWCNIDGNDLRGALEFLVRKYVNSEAVRSDLLVEIYQKDWNNIGVKGILHEISASSVSFDMDDSELIKKIAFNFA